MSELYGNDPIEPTDAQVEEHLNSQAMTTPEPTVEEVLKQKAKLFQKAIINAGNCTYEEALAFQGAGQAFSALQAVLAMCSRNGYTTWDRDKVPLVDGKYDVEECKKWEAEHGHDIRLKCYPEFGCQLLLDPQDIREAIERELK